MSATITLKQTMARRSGATLNIIQHALVIVAIIVVLAIINLFVSRTPSVEVMKSATPDLSDLSVLSALTVLSDPAEEAASQEPVSKAPAPAALSPRMQGALDYVKRRYKVAPEALMPVFEVAQLIGQETRIDPLLIVAIIGIESGFNPFAESSMGARGLMQIIPRLHRDKVPGGAGAGSLLDPLINIRVGVQVLEEAIRRRGGLVAGLQSYAGSSEPDGSYSSKVLAEKERLEQAAARRGAPASA